MTDIPLRQIRAVYDDDTIRVYQAYGSAIADSLHANGRFVDPPFKLTRMTWIKPSFLWMMYRCGWSDKDDGQRRVFAFDISRDGFEWALAHSCSSHPEGLAPISWCMPPLAAGLLERTDKKTRRCSSL